MQPLNLGSAWTWQPLTLLLMMCAVLLYVNGWRRLHRIEPALADWRRLIAFFGAMSFLLLALFSPLYGLSSQFLAARTLQKVFVAMLAAPLLWLACPFHVMAWGLASGIRRHVSRAVLRPTPVRSALRQVTQPVVTLLFFVSAFLLWHDPQIANWAMSQEWSQRFTLWLLFGAAVLYWWHVVGTGPRLHPSISGWLVAASLVLVEVPNMASGIAIAFAGRPLYDYYAMTQASLVMPVALGTLEDQMVSGALVWVTGSIVYISTLILVVHRLFIRDGGSAPEGGFGHSIADRAMAPGLESRPAYHPWDRE